MYQTLLYIPIYYLLAFFQHLNHIINPNPKTFSNFVLVSYTSTAVLPLKSSLQIFAALPLKSLTADETAVWKAF